MRHLPSPSTLKIVACDAYAVQHTHASPPINIYLRIAAKMHEERIAMEAQIREEIKAEYHTDWDPEVIYDDGEYNELEGRIVLDELLQVEEDREQWRSEREAVRTMLSNSKAEFDEVCKGLKSECSHP